MIRLELQGGLGNQLFIWAMAHHLSAHFNEHVRILYPLSKKNRLDRPCEIAGLLKQCDHNVSLFESKSLGFVTRLIDKIDSIQNLKKIAKLDQIGIFTESFSSDAKSDYKKSPKLIRGYFQNASMIDSITDGIRDELNSYLESISLPISVKVQEIEITAHIRRGDTKSISQDFGVLSFEYYKEKLGSHPNAAICTDELSDFEGFHREFPDALIITPNESDSWQTLKILSRAEKLIMANSTLSWWGAWIAKQGENSEIVFPFPWRPTETQNDHAIVMSDVMLADSLFEQTDID